MWMFLVSFRREARGFQTQGAVEKRSSSKVAAIVGENVSSGREHGKMARTLLLDFFNSASF